MASTDRDVLLYLYLSTDGANWTNRAKWGTDADISDWYGVEVNAGGRVYKLQLHENNLRGPIPKELGSLSELKELKLCWNNLTGPIPKELGALSKLERLLLGQNILTGPIPKELGSLSELKELSLYWNRLTDPIPSELGHLSALKRLNLSENQLSGPIPKELGSLSELEDLNLRWNKLTGSIPQELGDLSALNVLDISRNTLGDISKGAAQALHDLEKRRDGRLHFKLLPGNQWRNPQTAVVKGGFGDIVKFWEAIELSGSTQSWKLKVVLVGSVNAGKTSLARGMVHGEPRLCGEDDRTKGVDVHEPCTPDASGKLELVFWDFAGHSEYFSTHQLFLSEGALHLLVIDLKRFSENPSERGDLVGIWLDALQCRVPGANVLVIANKFDGWEGDHETILGELSSAVKGHLKAATAELEPARQHSSTSPEKPSNLVVHGVEIFSAADADSLLGLREKLAALARREDFFPSVGQVLPVSWVRVRAVLEAKRSGNDPVLEASLIGAQAERCPAAPGRSGVAVKFLRWEDGVSEWERVVRALKLGREVGVKLWDHFRAINFWEGVGRTDKAEAVFKGAVGLLVREGTVLLSGEVLYVEPTWINELLRAILDHQLTDETMNNFWEIELKAFVRDRAGADFLKLKKVHDNFCSTGTLTVGYLRFLWRNVLGIGDEDVFLRVLATTSHHGVIFKGAPARTGDEDIESELDDDSKLFVPVRLPSNILSSNLLEWETMRRYQYRKELIYNIPQSSVPPGVLGLMMARFLSCEGVELHACWSRGAAFAMGGPEVLVYLNNSREGVNDRADITVQVFGQELSGDLHNAVKKVQETIGAIFAEYFSGLLVALERGHPRSVRGVDAGLERIDSLQAHISRLEGMLNIRLSGLEKLVDIIKGESMQGLGQVKSALDSVRLQLVGQDKGDKEDMPAEWGERLRSLESLVERHDGVMKSVDYLVAMMMAERAEKISAPRFVCVLPPWDFSESRGLSPEEMDPSVWTARFADWRDGDFKDGKNFFETEMRVFPVCAFSGELVPCGHEGHGYQVKRARKWVRAATSVANALMPVVARHVGHAEPLAAPAMGAAQLGAKYAAKKAQPGDSARFAGKLRNDGISKNRLDLMKELKGVDYESVRKFIHEMEIRTRMEINSKMRKVLKVRRGDPGIPDFKSDFIYFEEEMVQVQARDGDGAAQWVLEKHKDAWYKKMRPASSSSDEG